MRKEIEDIREALISIDALDEETGAALVQLEESIDELESHPAADKLRSVASDTASEVHADAKGREAAVSEQWHSLKDHVEEWEDHHPRVTLVIGKMAEALSVVGL
ncbi:MAG: hypothetical protein P1U85_09355 [Verrucomicrobiales bacterium]|jgi:hypothetical protein|nr:hypothetical protein [Verrucomicrobiales bacterium]